MALKGVKQTKEHIEKRMSAFRISIRRYFDNGGRSGMLGNKHSEETKKKMSEVRLRRKKLLGYLISQETRKKLSEAHKGEKNPMYGKFGEKHPAWIKDRSLVKHQDKRITTDYKLWREAVWKRDDYRCMDCGEKNGKIQADHIYQFAKYPRLRLMPENGQTLCKNCHRAKTVFEKVGTYCYN